MRRTRAFHLVVMVAFCTIAGGIAQLGCAAIFGLDETSLRDPREGGGGTDASEAGADAADGGWDPDGTFLLQSTVRLVGENGPHTKVKGEPLLRHQYELLVHMADGGFAGPFYGIHTSTPAVEELRFEGLPAGERYVRQTRLLGSTVDVTYYIAQGNGIDIGWDKFQRADAVPAPNATDLRIHPTGVSDAGPTVDVLYGGDAPVRLYNRVESAPVWSSDLFLGRTLIDGTRGDVAWVAREQTRDGWTEPVQICKLPEHFRMGDDGGVLTAFVECQDPPPKEPVGISMWVDQFQSAAQPGAVLVSPLLLSVEAAPGAGVFGVYPVGSTLAQGRLSPPFPPGFYYSNPAPKTWSVVTRADMMFTKTYVALPDGGTHQRDVTVSTSSVLAGSWVRGSQLLAAPSKITVGGKDVLGDGFVSEVGLTPRIVIAPNASGPQPTRYLIMLDGRSRYVHIYTHRHELILPEFSLIRGDRYDFRMIAFYAPSNSAKEPMRDGLPRSYVEVIGNSFSP